MKRCQGSRQTGLYSRENRITAYAIEITGIADGFRDVKLFVSGATSAKLAVGILPTFVLDRLSWMFAWVNCVRAAHASACRSSLSRFWSCSSNGRETWCRATRSGPASGRTRPSSNSITVSTPPSSDCVIHSGTPRINLDISRLCHGGAIDSLRRWSVRRPPSRCPTFYFCISSRRQCQVAESVECTGGVRPRALLLSSQLLAWAACSITALTLLSGG